MEKMKLYTEEQVKKICKYFDFPIKVINEVLQMKPIELPSDEEIEEASPIVNINSHDYYFGHKDGFIEGAEWVIEQIKQQGNDR